MPHHGFGQEPRFGGQRPRRSLYADDLPSDADRASTLFNDALDEVARRSWREAEDTLCELLEITPDDGEALVLLAKVYVARGRLEHALNALDSAQRAGCAVDPQLRHAILDRLHRAESLAVIPDMDDMTPSVPQPGVKDAVAARQQSFLLRQDNQDLLDKVSSLEKEVRRWIFATMGVCVTATALVTWALVPPIPASQEPNPTLATVITPVRRVIRPPAESPTPLDRIAEGVIPGISNSLGVQLVDGVALATGELADFRERTAIEKAWRDVAAVKDVDWTDVLVTSRVEGGRLQVREGDTLSAIAFRYYGDATATAGIERENRIEAERLKPGQFLNIPPLERGAL